MGIIGLVKGRRGGGNIILGLDLKIFWFQGGHLWTVD